MTSVFFNQQGTPYAHFEDEDSLFAIAAQGLVALQFLDVGIPGPAGPPGGVIYVQADEDIQAGQAVKPNVAGRMVLAQANSMVNSRQVAIAQADTLTGFACPIRQDFVTLTDWTEATGSTNLLPGANYFLSNIIPGMLTTTPPSSGVVLSVGIAVNSTTLSINLGSPILL